MVGVLFYYLPLSSSVLFYFTWIHGHKKISILFHFKIFVIFDIIVMHSSSVDISH